VRASETVKRLVPFLQAARPHWLCGKHVQQNLKQNKRGAPKDRAAAERKIAATEGGGPRSGWSRGDTGAVRARPGGAGGALLLFRVRVPTLPPAPVAPRSLASLGLSARRDAPPARSQANPVPSPNPAPRGAAPAPGLARVRGDGDRAPAPTGRFRGGGHAPRIRRGIHPGGGDPVVAVLTRGSPSSAPPDQQLRPCAAAAADLPFPLPTADGLTTNC
jgi:hypothetical protein